MYTFFQYKMFTTNIEDVQDHMYSSEASEWPFLTRGIAYWVSPHSNVNIIFFSVLCLYIVQNTNSFVVLKFNMLTAACIISILTAIHHFTYLHYIQTLARKECSYIYK